MKYASSILAGLLAFSAGCTSEDSSASSNGGNPSSKPSADNFEFVVWPESGSTVFSNSAIYVGNPAAEGKVPGKIAVIVGGEAPKPGSALPASAIQFAAGSVHGDIMLPPGKHTLHVHHFGADGKATELGQTVEYTVEKTPDDLGVQWLEPADGAKVKSPFKVKFGLTGAGMSPAGQNALDKTLGHHHISVNKGVVTPGLIMPMDTGDYMHYGKAQTEAEVKLEPGEYELTMQFADAAHRSYGKALAKTIRITVE